MTAYNVVRFRTKPGREKDFVRFHEDAEFEARGFRKAALVQTADREFCFVGEWDDFDSLAAARPAMISMLNSVRDLLEDLGEGRGVTDPVSGTAVVEMTGRQT